jgi:hypothetical protein
MFIVTRSPKIALLSLAVSVGIFLILYGPCAATVHASISRHRGSGVRSGQTSSCSRRRVGERRNGAHFSSVRSNRRSLISL